MDDTSTPKTQSANPDLLSPDNQSSKTLQETVKSEIDNAQDLESALDAHDQKWRRERDKLSNSSLPTPEFDLGSRQHRSLLSEYQERRNDWHIQQSTIVRDHEYLKAKIRNNGTTLSSTFEQHGRSKSSDFKVPAPERNKGRSR